MNSNYIISELKKNKLVFNELLENLDDNLITWKSTPDKWSLLEIVCHLVDEEINDFRARLKSTLENPEKELIPIDPIGWVISKKYIEQNYNTKLVEFLNEREKSIIYLEQLKEPKWDNFYQHAKFGKLSAKLFFTNWLAHDYLHIRQIIKLKYDYLSFTSKENLNYAGNW